MSESGSLGDFEDGPRSDPGPHVDPTADPDSDGELVDAYRERRQPVDDGTLPIFVGDHVEDVERDDEARMLVVGLPHRQADEYEYKEGATIADANPEYPADDEVVECTFLQRTDKEIAGSKSYGYPRSRLRVVASIHDVKGDKADG